MKLTTGEFCLFNMKSRMQLLREKGKLLSRKIIDERHDLQLFMLWDFYVEVLRNYNEQKIVRVEPLYNTGLLNIYYGYPVL